MRNLGCLVVAILLLPIFLIIIGPLLVLVAVRGRQSVGPIMLNSAQYGPAGRIGALMLGLGLWLLIWGGLVWVIVNGLLPGSTPSVAVVTPTLAPPLAVEQPASSSDSSDDAAGQPDIVSAPTPTDISLPTNTPTVLVIIDPTATPDLEATPPITNALPTDTPDTASATGTAESTNTTVLTETIVLTGTTVATDTDVFAVTPEPTVILIATPADEGSQPTIDVTDVQTVTMSLADTQTVLGTIEDGNALLREAISLANEENIANLERVWQGRALEKAEEFATDLYDRYAKPFDVEFKYLSVPAVKRSTPDEVTVVSQEIWTYGGSAGLNQEAFEFTYVLSQQDDVWVITYYSYLNVPTPMVVATTTTTTPTPAPTLTSQ